MQKRNKAEYGSLKLEIPFGELFGLGKVKILSAPFC